jgi:T5SS/PEP-CTERM-associated repeat protein
MKIKSASQTAQKFSQNAILLIVSAVALCASPAIALAESCIGETDWKVASGSWFVADNWTAGVPNSFTRAQISNGGTATIGSTGAASCDLNLPASATQSGRLVVDHGSLDITFDAAVGSYGRGVLTITNGGSVTAASATIAATSGSVGTVSVDGGSFTLAGGIYVGGDAGSAGGTGLLTVTNGGTVTAASSYVWSSGTLTGNCNINTTSGTTVEGTLEPSSGRLTIGGNLTFFGSAALMQSNVVPASADNVYVSGGAASLTGRLKVRLTGTFTAGTTYTLLHCDGLRNGTFSTYSINYPTGQCFSPVVSYDAHNVYLTLVSCD